MKEEKGATEDEMVGLHHPLNGQELGHLWEILKDWAAWHAIFMALKSTISARHSRPAPVATNHAAVWTLGRMGENGASFLCLLSNNP